MILLKHLYLILLCASMSIKKCFLLGVKYIFCRINMGKFKYNTWTCKTVKHCMFWTNLNLIITLENTLCLTFTSCTKIYEHTMHIRY